MTLSTMHAGLYRLIPASKIKAAGWLVILLLAVFSLNSAKAQQKPTTLFVLSGDSTAYTTFKTSIQNKKENNPHFNQDWVFVDIKDTNPGQIEQLGINSEIIVSIGEPAAKLINSLNITSIHITTFLSIEDYQALNESKHRNNNHCAVVIDQPIERIVKVAKNHLPNFNLFGVINSDITENRTPYIDTTIGTAKIISETIVDNIHTTIRKLSKKNVDAIIAFNNTDVYNSHTVRNILISSYHFNIPIIGYSSGFVRAGALVGIYSEPDSIASDVAWLVQNPDQCVNSAIIHPSSYTVEINKQVARSLGIVIQPDYRKRTFKDSR